MSNFSLELGDDSGYLKWHSIFFRISDLVRQNVEGWFPWRLRSLEISEVKSLCFWWLSFHALRLVIWSVGRLRWSLEPTHRTTFMKLFGGRWWLSSKLRIEFAATVKLWFKSMFLGEAGWGILRYWLETEKRSVWIVPVWDYSAAYYWNGVDGVGLVFVRQKSRVCL